MARTELIKIEASVTSIDQITRDLSAYPKAQAVIVSRAVNKVATAARTEINTSVRKNLAIKTRDLNKTIKLVKANTARPQAKIRIKGRRIPLAQFAASQTRAGVAYRISPGGGRKTIKSTFLAKMESGHRGVFTRLGEKRQMKRGRYTGPQVVSFMAGGRNRVFIARNKKRQPIVEKFGPSVNAVFGNIAEMSVAVLDRRVATQLEKEIVTQIGVFKSRGGK